MDYSQQLIGDFYTPLSDKADSQDAINLYVERIQSGQGRSPFAMFRHFGLRPLTQSATESAAQGCRGMLELNDNLFTVQGAYIWQWDDPTNVNPMGSVPQWNALGTFGPISNVQQNPLSPVSIAASENSLFVVSEGHLYRIFGGFMTEATGLDFTPLAVATLSGLVVALATTMRRIYFSNDDGATWGSLDFESVLAGPPNQLLNMVVDHEELWIFGTRMTQVFVLTSDANFPLAPVPSGLIMAGLGSFGGFCQLDNTIFVLGRTAQGDHTVWRASGYRPERISTPAIENQFRSYPDHRDAIMSSYELNGHACLRISFPSANGGLGITWEYDVSTQRWGKVQWWNLQTGTFERHRCPYYVSAFDRIIAGDHTNGWLYELTPDEYTDFGYPLPWFRRTPHVTANGKKVAFSRFDLFVNTGEAPAQFWLNTYQYDRLTFVEKLFYAQTHFISEPYGILSQPQADMLMRIYDRLPYVVLPEAGAPTNSFIGALPATGWPLPEVMQFLGFVPWGSIAQAGNDTLGGPPSLYMRYSNNAGKAFTDRRYRSLGLAGDYNQRLYWNGLGSSRDRVWEFGGDAPVKTCIVGGELTLGGVSSV